ncbi:hypothetical protein LCGC14_0288870 [marine sediment metagenome]|uniref:Uncharacterized protein n=1 Tax=marine sediment metagenome TaxID=412755 RepID=A0A0F9TTR2_9ZZZZ
MSRRSTVAQSKQAERDVALLLGGRRLHAGEWKKKGDADVAGPGFVAQVKQRSGVSTYITEGMRQIQEAAQGTDDLPLLVIRTKPGRGHGAQTFVVLEVGDFIRYREGNSHVPPN